MNRDDSQKSFIERLEEDGDIYWRQGRFNNIVDICLNVTTVLASLAATVLAAAKSDGVPRWLIACIAAVPAAITSLQRIIGIRERSNWYFVYSANVRALAIRLMEGGKLSLSDAYEKYAELGIEMESKWVGIGGARAAPADNSANRLRKGGNSPDKNT